MYKSNIKWNSISDRALAETIGAFIKHHRLEQNKTQNQLSEEAGINRSTLVKFEKGVNSTLLTFIQLLRALNMLYVLQQFQAEQQLSPIQLAELEQAKRKRATKIREDKKRKSNW